MARGDVGPHDMRLRARCFLAIVFVRLALSVAGYDRLRRHLPKADRQPADLRYSRVLAYHVARAARWVPHASCLTQAMCLQWILARSGHAAGIAIGVRRAANGEAIAHAWVIVRDTVVMGGPRTSYAPLIELT